MKTSELAAIVLRLLAIYCFIQAVLHLHEFVLALTMVANLSKDVENIGITNVNLVILSLLPTIALLTTGLGLFQFSGPLGRRLAGNTSEYIVASRWSTQDVQSVAFAVAGVVIVVLAIPQMIHTISQLIYLSGQELHAELMTETWRNTWVTLAGAGLQFVIGLGLFFGSRVLSAMWHRLRSAGT